MSVSSELFQQYIFCCVEATGKRSNEERKFLAQFLRSCEHEAEWASLLVKTIQEVGEEGLARSLQKVPVKLVQQMNTMFVYMYGLQNRPLNDAGDTMRNMFINAVQDGEIKNENVVKTIEKIGVYIMTANEMKAKFDQHVKAVAEVLVQYRDGLINESEMNALLSKYQGDNEMNDVQMDTVRECAQQKAHDTEEKATVPSVLSVKDDRHMGALDVLLGQTLDGSVTLKNILDIYNGASDAIKKAEDAQELTKKLEASIKEMNEKHKRALASAAASAVPTSGKVEATGSEIPAGEYEMKNCAEIFGIKDKALEGINLPVYTWEGANTWVPEIDDNFIFHDVSKLTVCCYSLATGENIWDSGPSGAGKTTWYEQMAARMGWMCMSANFDAGMGRLELMGRDKLFVEDGATKSEFVEGIVPFIYDKPFMYLANEQDFIREDAAYIQQRVAELKPIVLNEDGGRVINPHTHFRMVATANTNGKGDDTGLYRGAKVQSSAYLNRYGTWVKSTYMSAEHEKALLSAKVPAVSDEDRDKIVELANRLRRSMLDGEIMEVVSPRDTIAMARKCVAFGELPMAVTFTLLNRVGEMDYQAVLQTCKSVCGHAGFEWNDYA